MVSNCYFSKVQICLSYMVVLYEGLRHFGMLKVLLETQGNVRDS